METRYFVAASVKAPGKPLRAMWLSSVSSPRFAARSERALSFESFEAASSVAKGTAALLMSMRSAVLVGDWAVVPLEVGA